MADAAPGGPKSPRGVPDPAPVKRPAPRTGGPPVIPARPAGVAGSSSRIPTVPGAAPPPLPPKAPEARPTGVVTSTKIPAPSPARPAQPPSSAKMQNPAAAPAGPAAPPRPAGPGASSTRVPVAPTAPAQPLSSTKMANPAAAPRAETRAPVAAPAPAQPPSSAKMQNPAAVPAGPAAPPRPAAPGASSTKIPLQAARAETRAPAAAPASTRPAQPLPPSSTKMQSPVVPPRPPVPPPSPPPLVEMSLLEDDEPEVTLPVADPSELILKTEASPSNPPVLVLKNKIAVLEERVAHGGFGEIWCGRVLNPFALVAERVVRGEDSPKWLGLDDLPLPEPVVDADGLVPETIPITDPLMIQKVYDGAERLWNEYLVKNAADPGAAREAYHGLLEMIDPILLDNPKIAVKVLKPALPAEQVAKDPSLAVQIRSESERRFAKESDLLRRLRHPNIVRRFGLVIDPDVGWCMLLEYIEGDDLEKVMKKLPHHRLPLPVAAVKVLEIAEALEFAHKQGILHRDLKPANIMLSAKDGRAILTDFGIGRWTDESMTQQLTMPGSMVGTPRYMAPEQIAGEKLTERTDMYQLGTLLFEMVAGQPAYGGLDQTTLFTMIAKGDVAHPVYIREVLPDISADFEALVEVARDKDPRNRWEFEEFIEKAKAIIAGQRYTQRRTERSMSQADVKRAYRRVVRLRKELSWREHRLGTEIHYVRLQEGIRDVRRLLEEKRHDDAMAAVEELTKDVQPLSDRYAGLKDEVAKLVREVQLAVSQDRAFRMLALAAGHLGHRNFPAVGATLNAAEQHLHALPEEGYVDVRNVFRRLREKFEPYRPFVEVFNTVTSSFVQEVARGIRDLYQLTAAMQPVEASRIRSLLEKVRAAEILLQSIHADKIGPAYEKTVKGLQEQRDALESLRQSPHVK
jgi:serine/threonine protein kinase